MSKIISKIRIWILPLLISFCGYFLILSELYQQYAWMGIKAYNEGNFQKGDYYYTKAHNVGKWIPFFKNK